MPKVSVIIPTYNRAGYIVETLRSVFAQTFTDYEVIVVDDGSTDDTADVLKPFLDRITYIRKENGGQGSARNAGIRLAKGEYIAFLDSDDLWLPEKLDVQVKYLDEHPEMVLVFTDAVIFFEDAGSHKKMGEIRFSGRDVSFERLFRMNFIPNLTTMVRKSCFDLVGLFNESRDLIGGEDYEMWLRIAMRFSLAHIPKITASYRHHDNNVVGTDLEKNYSMHLRVIQSILKRYPDVPGKFGIDMHEYFKNYFYCSGRNLYQSKNYKFASEYLRKALSYNMIAPKAWVLYFLSMISRSKEREG